MSDTLMLDDPGISIGDPADGGMGFLRTWANSAGYQTGGWTHNYVYGLIGNILARPYTTTVVLGQRNIPFIQTTTNGVTTYAPQKQDGTSLACNGTNCTFVDRDGTVVNFIAIGADTVASSLKRSDGETWTFTYSQFSNGTQYPYVYLQSIQSNFGYQIKLQYQSQHLEIMQAKAINSAVDYCDPTAASCTGLSNSWPTISFSRGSATFSANAPFVETAPYTESVSDNAGNVRSFAITPDASQERMTSRTPGPSGTGAISYTYTVSSQTGAPPPPVASIADASGTWRYGFSIVSSATNPPVLSTLPPAELQGANIFGYDTTTRTTPQGGVSKTNSIQFLGNVIPILVSWQDELSRLTQYQYNSTALPTVVIPPEGTLSGSTPTAGYMQNQYDGRGNVVVVTKVAKSGSSLPNIVYRAGFDASCSSPAKCNKPNWTQDALGHETDYTYDPTHGGILSEMQPAPSSGAARPLILTTWSQIYGWTKNASGTLVQAASPIWRKATQTECQTVAGSSTATCDSSAPQKVTTYQYGASGTRFALLAKGIAVASGGTTLRTCYGYDIYNRKISETTPNANLGVCP